MQHLKTWVEINGAAVMHNVGVFRGCLNKKTAIWAVVKSNAYGHGFSTFTKLAAEAGVDGFCVDSVPEALKIRLDGITQPILVLGPTLPNLFREAAQKNITLSFSTMHSFEELVKEIPVLAERPAIHVKVDTGMHRRGVYLADLAGVAQFCKKNEINLTGVFSHFAAAKDTTYLTYSNQQLENFEKAIECLKEQGFPNLTRHIAATGGTMIGCHLASVSSPRCPSCSEGDARRANETDVENIGSAKQHRSSPEQAATQREQSKMTDHIVAPPRSAAEGTPSLSASRAQSFLTCSRCGDTGEVAAKRFHFDAVRIGIGFYGIYPSKELEMQCAETFKLQPVLSWHALISEVKPVPKGEFIGYDLTEKVTRDTMIAIVPIGYWHGLPWALSGIGYVLIGGKRAKILGRVSMDMVTVDVTDIVCAVGDVATLIGRQEGEEITAREIANRCNTSPYEIITRLNPLIERSSV